jgi:hypothetical protein
MLIYEINPKQDVIGCHMDASYVKDVKIWIALPPNCKVACFKYNFASNNYGIACNIFAIHL